jgi:hypothetical protein
MPIAHLNPFAVMTTEVLRSGGSTLPPLPTACRSCSRVHSILRPSSLASATAAARDVSEMRECLWKVAEELVLFKFQTPRRTARGRYWPRWHGRTLLGPQRGDLGRRDTRPARTNRLRTTLPLHERIVADHRICRPKAPERADSIEAQPFTQWWLPS